MQCRVSKLLITRFNFAKVVQMSAQGHDTEESNMVAGEEAADL